MRQIPALTAGNHTKISILAVNGYKLNRTPLELAGPRPEGKDSESMNQIEAGTNHRRLWLLSLITAFFWAPTYFYLQTLSPFIQELGGGVGIVGLIGGAYGLTQLLLRIPLGIWSDRIGLRKPFIFGGFLAAVLSALIFIRAIEPTALFWARAMAGVSATTWVVVVIYVAALFPEMPAKILGRLYAIASLSQLAASTLGASMSARWGWRAPFWASLAAALAGLGLLPLLGREERVRGQVPDWRSLLKMLGEQSIIRASLLCLVVRYGYWAMVSFTPLLATRLGWGRGDLFWLSPVDMIPSIAGSMMVDRVVRRLGSRNTLAGAFALFALGAVAAPLCPNTILLCLASAVTGLSRGLAYPLLMTLSMERVSPEQKGTAMGIFQAVYSIGMFAGPALSGVLAGLAGGGLFTPFFLTSLLMVAGGLIPALAIGWDGSGSKG